MRHDPLPPRQQWLHSLDCECDTCTDPRPALPRPLTSIDFAGHMLAGIIVGNAIVFAWKGRAALAAFGIAW